MDDSIILKWHMRHQNGSEYTFNPQLWEWWEKSEKIGVDPQLNYPVIDTSSMLETRKQASIKPYVYVSRVLYLTMQYFKNDTSMGFAFFDKDAVLIKLFGEKKFIHFAAKHGFKPMSMWDFDHLGANAVSAGFSCKQSIVFTGDENYCRLLVDTAIYFSPITVTKEGQVNVIGGLALIMPYEKRQHDYLAFVALITNDANIHMYMSDALHHMYDFEPRGFLIIDNSWKTGKKTITYYNKSLRSIFHLEEKELSFLSVDSIFDPYPDNKELWEIINEEKKVENRQLRLQVHGKSGNYTVSSELFYNPNVCLRGIRLYITSLEQTAAHVSRQIGDNTIFTFDDIIGESKNIINAKQRAIRYAASDSNVLILGESGVGKDIFAQAINNQSARSDKPFISVNCGALPRDLIASELFGYEHGAFTGAKKGGHIGKFELANGGTIFLDEIGDMPLDLQISLLQVIEKKSFTKIGGKQTIHVDVKIISATNANLLERIRQGRFRLDLYYRLSVLCLHLPSLRDRGDDVTLLSKYFLNKLYQFGKITYPASLSPEAVEYLKTLPWHGNVRELQNVMEGVVQTLQISKVEPRHIMYYMGAISDLNEPLPKTNLLLEPDITVENNPNSCTTVSDEELFMLPTKITSYEAKKEYPFSNRKNITREELYEALCRNHYHREATAQDLGISRKTLYRWMKKLGLSLC